MFSVTVEADELDNIFSYLDRLEAGIGESSGPLSAMVENITVLLEGIASGLAPYLTGTLSDSHASRMVSAVWGQVYLESLENPLLGGFTDVYGPIVHIGRPWMVWAMNSASGSINNIINQFISQLFSML